MPNRCGVIVIRIADEPLTGYYVGDRVQFTDQEGILASNGRLIAWAAVKDGEAKPMVLRAFENYNDDDFV